MQLSELNLTKADFDSIPWENVVAQSKDKDCHSYNDIFFTMTKEAEKNGNQIAQKVYFILGSITSPFLKTDSVEQPFSPMFEYGNARSPLPEDFSDSLLDTLKEIVPTIKDAELRARIADIIWIRKRDYRMAQVAIDAYLESARILEDPEKWIKCEERIRRAFRLAFHIGNRELINKVISHISSILDKYNGDDPFYLSAKLMELLQECKHGDPLKYAEMAEKAAKRAETEHDWGKARTYWERAFQWYIIYKDEQKKINIHRFIAETYVNEADDAINLRKPPSYSVAASFIESAIQVYRKIKSTPEIKLRIEELHKLLLKYEAKIHEELGQVTTQVDFSKEAKMAMEMVKGKTLHESLLILVSICNIPKVKELRTSVLQMAKEAPISFMIATVAINDQGKVIGKKPTAMLGDSVDTEAAIRAEMFNHAKFYQQGNAFGIIEPARQQIILEHNVRPSDFLSIVNNNIFVPPGREHLFAKGLYFGLIGDFMTACHILIPQLENSIRTLLQNAGIITSGLDQEGIQDEHDLNKLLYHPRINEILNEDLIFDLRGLLVERFGSNLRNKLAHGLMDDVEFSSPLAVYLWWTVLRLCCLPILARIKKKTDKMNNE